MLNFNKVLMSIIVIPLSYQGNWKLDAYSKISPNSVSFSQKGISIKVNNSAGPLLYYFDHPIKLKQIKIAGEFKGLPTFLDYSLQGEKGYDDYPLRVGLILDGDKKLSIVQKVFSPEWIKRLYNNISPERGIDYIQFYNVTQNPSQVGKSRIHPLSDLLHENFFAYLKERGLFSYDIKTDVSQNVSGIWISSDGDDTHSQYEVDISNLQLQID